MFRWFRKARDLVAPLPDLRAERDMTGNTLGMDYLIAAMGENKEVPSVGDVVIELESCSMGMTVRRDIRHRVTGSGCKLGSSIAVPTTMEDGETDLLHVFYMRRHTRLPRTWVLCN